MTNEQRFQLIIDALLTSAPCAAHYPEPVERHRQALEAAQFLKREEKATVERWQDFGYLADLHAGAG